MRRANRLRMRGWSRCDACPEWIDCCQSAVARKATISESFVCSVCPPASTSCRPCLAPIARSVPVLQRRDRRSWLPRTFRASSTAPRRKRSFCRQEAIQHGKQFARRTGRAGIVDHLAVATGVDKAEGAELGKMLRQGRLAELNSLGKDTDRKFAAGQMVHDQKPLLISQQVEKGGGGFRIGGKFFRNHRFHIFLRSPGAMGQRRQQSHKPTFAMISSRHAHSTGAT